ncbi:MAG: efflux RND transporter periplasmic adaptor subunit, partial [Bacteroidota bacterium]
MKSNAKIIHYLWLLLPLGFWQCSESVGKGDQATEEVTPYVRKFNTISAEPGATMAEIKLTGRVIAKDKISVVAQVQGIALATAKRFKEGVIYQKGDVLIAIDDGEFVNGLIAQKSQYLSSLVRIMSDVKLDYPQYFEAWNRYLSKVDLNQPLPEIPQDVPSNLRYYLAANNIYNLYYSIKSQEEKANKFIIRAPFKGVVTKSNINPGSLVNPGVMLGEFIRTDELEILSSVSLADAGALAVGDNIEFRLPGERQSWSAQLSRMGSTVESGSQTVPLYFSISGSDLREGTFLEATHQLDAYEASMELPKSVVTSQNQVYVIEDAYVKLHDITPLEFRAETI